MKIAYVIIVCIYIYIIMRENPTADDLGMFAVRDESPTWRVLKQVKALRCGEINLPRSIDPMDLPTVSVITLASESMKERSDQHECVHLVPSGKLT